MKKILLLLLLVCGFAHGQIITFPDANFKAKLLEASPSVPIALDNLGNQITIDVNGDNEIEVSEALLVYTLKVNSTMINELVGIEYFQNLLDLNCSVTSILELDLSSLVNLKNFTCTTAQLASLNVSGMTNLENLSLSFNQLTSLDLSNLTNLKNVTCSHNLISTINVQGATSLYQLTCSDNLLTSLDLDSLSGLTILYCYNNSITSLSLNGLNNLHEVQSWNNQISSLEIIDCSQIYSANFSNNLLTSIAISGSTDIKRLDVNNNNFVDVDFVTSLGNLEFLDCSDNPITNLDLVSSLPDLEGLYCSNTLISTLDLSNNHNFIGLQCFDNPNLISLFLKFGNYNLSIPDGYPLFNTPNLQYVCVDDFRVAAFSNYFILENMNNVVVNSYCNFTPGGNFNTLTGSVLFDGNNDGCQNDVVQSFIKMNVNDGTNEGSSFTNIEGDYIFYALQGNFTVTPQFENPSIFTVSPASTTVSFPLLDSSVSTNNFCITANGVVPNAEIVVAPVTPARPGFDAEYKIVFKNTGNQMLSGQVYFYYEDGVLDLVSTSEPTSAQSTGLLTWNYNDLHPFESRSINVILNVNGPMETPAINNGDELMFNVGLNPINNNEIVFSYPQIVVGSFDPNDIICLQGENEAPSEIGNYLHYIVNFENTGTAPAENVVVKVEIDATKYDLPSLQLLSGSHPVEARVKNNVAEFIFKTINLETNGHGNILLKVRSKATLNVGDTVTKKANIFFDYNFPILTNDANTTFQDLSVAEHLQDKAIAIYPNPSRDIVNIEASSVIHSVQVYDIQGRLLLTHLASDFKTRIDIADKASGVYFFRIQSDKGIKVEKIIKK